MLLGWFCEDVAGALHAHSSRLVWVEHKKKGVNPELAKGSKQISEESVSH